MEKSLTELRKQLLSEAEQKEVEQVEVRTLPQKLVETTNLDEDEGKSLSAQIAEMTAAQKMKLAMTGNKIARQLLIRDTSKSIPMLVLTNPGVSEEEVLEYAKNTNLEGRVLRAIAENQSWMKMHVMRVAIVFNPKTPIDASSKWLKHLMDRDLTRLTRSKNVPSALVSQARRLIDKRAKK